MNIATKYALVTAAYNEERHIAGVIRSVLSQTILPAKWIIVSDGSTDRTDEIVREYSAANPFIELLRISEEHARNFAAQVCAINCGLSRLETMACDFVGNIDADITLPSDYFEQLLMKFERNPSLGIGGGTIYERGKNSVFKERRGNSTSSVAHGCQLFRRECLSAVGGAYVPLPYGGPDTYAEVVARSKSWQVESFRDLKVFHHRRTASVGGVLRGWFRQGKMDYSLGALPSFELIKLLRRIAIKPYVIGAVARLAGFCDSYRNREERAVSKEFISYIRTEQQRKLSELFRFRKSFRLPQAVKVRSLPEAAKE
jgi:glycosyltransferase involved in cell wall biosynthesis